MRIYPVERKSHSDTASGGEVTQWTDYCGHSHHFEAEFPGWTGHIFSLDENFIVGDGNGVIRMWRWDGERYLGPRLLCRHDSSMRFQESHPHTRISPDGKYVVFSSDRRGGYVNVYTVPTADFESLPEIKGE